MKNIGVDLIKDLRRMSHASISHCKQALEESCGDIEEAIRILRKRGLEIAQSKKGRVAREGRVASYVHLGNKLGVLVEVNCETDFVARNEDFCQFTKDIAMQIAAANPAYIRKEDVPDEVMDKIDDKEAFYKMSCLLDQAFIKDPAVTIGDCMAGLIGKIGENIVINRFVRFKVGEE